MGQHSMVSHPEMWIFIYFMMYSYCMHTIRYRDIRESEERITDNSATVFNI